MSREVDVEPGGIGGMVLLDHGAEAEDLTSSQLGEQPDDRGDPNGHDHSPQGVFREAATTAGAEDAA